MTSAPPPQVTVESTEDDAWEGGTDRKKLKRPGLSQSLVPGKKVIKMYKEQKLREGIKKS